MRRPSRPAHHVLTPLEMAAWDDEAALRSRRESGLLVCLLLALSPMLAALAVSAMAYLGVLR